MAESGGVLKRFDLGQGDQARSAALPLWPRCRCQKAVSNQAVNGRAGTFQQGRRLGNGDHSFSFSLFHGAIVPLVQSYVDNDVDITAVRPLQSLRDLQTQTDNGVGDWRWSLGYA